ncbi:MAG: hypothetical protein IT542_14370 [Rubellimicrobium sp.]|nr:hypothetical protein [Rubellimicrobium sp.]
MARFRLPLRLIAALSGLLIALALVQTPARSDGMIAAATRWPGDEAPDCDRASFGGFTQRDHRDTRYHVLVAAAAGDLTFRQGSGGTVLVASGSWVDPYSGRLLRDVPAREIEIDHVIPVCWAWAHGASGWDRATRRAFYNDRRYLVAVEAGLNRLKGARGPDLFMPMNRDFACTYARIFLEGVAGYGLRVAPDEMARIEQARDLACAGHGLS